MSRIVKADQLPCSAPAQAPSRRVVQARRRAAAVLDAAQIMRAAEERAAAVLRAAEEQAAALLEDQQRELVRLREEAVRRGYEEGYAEGRAAGERAAQDAAQGHLAELAAAVRRASEELSQLRRQVLAEAEGDIVKFAILVAERVLRGELADPQRTWAIARSLLAEVADESYVKVFLPPCVGDPAEGRVQLATAAPGSGVRVEIEIDPSLGPGDVRVETRWGWLDGRAPVRWRRLVEALQRGAMGDD